MSVIYSQEASYFEMFSIHVLNSSLCSTILRIFFAVRVLRFWCQVWFITASHF